MIEINSKRGILDYSQAFRKTPQGPSRLLGWEITIRLTPKASQTKLGDLALDENDKPYLKVYVTAVPGDNKANKALIALLSKMFRIPKTKIHLISGATDRRKVIWFECEDCPMINAVSEH